MNKTYSFLGGGGVAISPTTIHEDFYTQSPHHSDPRISNKHTSMLAQWRNAKSGIDVRIYSKPPHELCGSYDRPRQPCREFSDTVLVSRVNYLRSQFVFRTLALARFSSVMGTVLLNCPANATLRTVHPARSGFRCERVNHCRL